MQWHLQQTVTEKQGVESAQQRVRTNDEDVRVHLTKWMPLQNTSDLMYIMNWCPNLFVLYVLNCTVSKLHFGDSSLFPSQKLLLLRQTTGRQKKRHKQHEKRNKYRKSETEHTQRMLGWINKEKDLPHYLFKVMHLLGNVMFFMFIKKTNVLPPLIFVLFSWQKGYMGSIYQKNAVNLFMEIAMEP